MHEFSIVNSLLDLCEDNARKNDATRVTRVEVKIGKLSGIEPHLLETAFNTFKEKTMCDGAEFIMHMQDVIAKCKLCSHELTVEENTFICPKCQGELEVLDGEEMFLMRLEME